MSASTMQPGASGRTRNGARPGSWLLPLIVPVLLVVVWWFASADSESPFFPSLSSIAEAFHQNWLFARVPTDVWPSLYRLFAGYLIAVVLGIALGLLLGRIRLLEEALRPVIQFARALPAVALIPAVILLIGIGDSAKIVLIAFCCVFPIMLNTIDGVRGVEPGLEDVSHSFRLTGMQRAFSVHLPSAMPQIFAGMRTSLSFAFILGIVTEMTGSTNGIGFVTIEAQQTFDLPLMWSGMILLALLGAALNLAFVLIERRILRWHHSSKASS